MSMESTDCCASGGTPENGYDLIVLGAGSAGFSAAITAAEQGAQVALVGHGTIGGTCVNVGCVPSKALIRAAETLHQGGTASRFTGIEAKASVNDWQAVISQKDELVNDLRAAKYLDLLPAYNSVAYLEGEARLAEGGVLIGERAVAADRIIIATGSRPAVPKIEGIEAVPYLTSTEALDLEELPASMMVIGAGYIGCELAQTFTRAGVKVTIVTRSRLLPQSEPEISDALQGYFADEGIEVVSGLVYRRIDKNEAGVQLTVSKDGEEQTINAETVLISTGRTPNSDGLGLTEAKVQVTPGGGIKVDDRMRTTAPGIYAAGDVTGEDQFVYMAAYGAKIAAENALNGDGRRYDNSAMPAVVFTDPQVASVGFTEARAEANKMSVKTSTLPLEYVPRALAARDTRGLIKLVADADSDRLIGAHILAPEGADSIQTAALAIQQGLTVQQVGEMIFPYLTTVEGLKLAAQTFEKDVAMLSCCAG